MMVRVEIKVHPTSLMDNPDTIVSSSDDEWKKYKLSMDFSQDDNVDIEEYKDLIDKMSKYFFQSVKHNSMLSDISKL